VTSIVGWGTAHPTVAGVALWVVGFPLVWTTLLLVRPVALLAPLRLCASVGEFTIYGAKFRVIEVVILLSPFVYRRRVFDRWIARHVAHARSWFEARDTVKERAVWVDLPVLIEGKPRPKLSPDDLREFFERQQVHLLIHGEGGAGKTSLACRIAGWAAADDGNLRLRAHLMLPVFLESDFVATGDEKPEHLAALIRQQLKAITGSTQDLPERFCTELCTSGRVLVVIDGLSERNAAVRKFIALHAGSDPLRCVVFTSRTDERDVLKHVPTIRLAPVRLQGDDLWTFMRTYVETVAAASVRFSERELMDLCERLSDLAGDRDITPMLATMYAGMAIARKSGDPNPDRPHDIPGLIFEYVRQIAQRAGYRVNEIDEVQTALKLVAWECVRETFRPRAVTRSQLATALASGMFGAGPGATRPGPALDQARTVVTDLETRLRLLQPAGAGGTEVRVVLDPVAEYMAAAHVCVQRGASAPRWKTFISDIDDLLKRYAPEELRGFLLAVRDCCVLTEVPSWLESALLERVGYDVRAQAESRRARRLRFFTRRLQTGGEGEPLEAISSIERGGYVDPDAEKALADAVKTRGPQVRSQAIYALAQLDCRSAGAQEALALALGDADEHVRFSGVLSVEIAGADRERQAAMILPLARDSSAGVRAQVATSLGHLSSWTTRISSSAATSPAAPRTGAASRTPGSTTCSRGRRGRSTRTSARRSSPRSRRSSWRTRITSRDSGGAGTWCTGPR
jgi:hypothetical protein